MADPTAAELASFQTHMERCMQHVLAPMRRPGVQVTIIVRAPEAAPGEAMVSTNGSLAAAMSALAHFAAAQR
jgi:hypothetical protein